MAGVKDLEIGFEQAIAHALAECGWTYGGDDARDRGWDCERALFPADVLAWLSTQYPDAYERAVPREAVGKGREAAQNRLLDVVVAQLRTKLRQDRSKGGSKGGLLGTLRNGWSHLFPGRGTAKFGPMVAFPPANPDITVAQQRADANILRVIRQVHFDTASNETIDLVLTVNGIPVVTMELKTDNTQSVEDAKRQYITDRVPGPTRPLLEPGRVLVHFAVSNSEVAMTTKLDGAETRFLPFNRGDHGHSGNEPVADGSATSYLWRTVLERSQFLRILETFVVWKPSGRGGTLVFPRYHQLRAVERVVADIVKRRETGAGPGRYLIQHSAGSGKTMTISWLAHRLARNFSEGEKTFDSVIVISDRHVLDRNLRDGIALLPASEGLVVAVGEKGGARSPQLKRALTEGGHIITCTVQTFPEVVRRIGMNGDFASRRWAVIADEAHSSQTGKAARALRQLLAYSMGNEPAPGAGNEPASGNASESAPGKDSEPEPGASSASIYEQILEDSLANATRREQNRNHAQPVGQEGAAYGVVGNNSGGEPERPAATAEPDETAAEEAPKAGEDDLMEAVDAAVAESSNITFVAFTATPKERTLELYGTKDPATGRFRAFDTYSMAQAIEEGFILDVLQNYSTYQMLIQVRDAFGRTQLVDKGEAVADIVRWANAEPKVIEQKAKAALEHFHANVQAEMRGQARAMVVTSERMDAYKWWRASREYLSHQPWGGEFQILVAFSGELDTPEGTVTEASLNGMSESATEDAFKDTAGPYRILIVANKYQTGFDEPRLLAMYVDKKLSGVATVQTLSRLNRIAPHKPQPMVLDFVNSPQSVLADFETYYDTAELTGAVDPNVLFEVGERMDTAGFYDPDVDIDAVAAVYDADDDEVNHEDLQAIIQPIVARWTRALRAAKQNVAAHAARYGSASRPTTPGSGAAWGAGTGGSGGSRGAGGARGDAYGDADDSAVAELNRVRQFKADARTYSKAWEFLSQVVDFKDADVHKRAILAKFLAHNLHEDRDAILDIAGVQVVGVRAQPDDIQGNLGLHVGDGTMDPQEFGAGRGGEAEEDTAAFSEAVEEANNILGRAGVHVSDERARGFITAVYGTLAGDATLQQMARENTPEQFRQAPALDRATTSAVFSLVKDTKSLAEVFLSDAVSMEGLKDVLASLLSQRAQWEAKQRALAQSEGAEVNR